MTTAAFMIVLSTHLAAAVGAAPDPCDPAVLAPCEGEDRLALRGHQFLHPTLQDTAIIATHVGLSEAGVILDADALPVGILGTRDVQLAGFQQRLEFALGITDWLGIHLDGRGGILVGRNVQSLLYKIGSLEAEGALSVALRILRSEASGTQLTVRLDGALNTGRDFSVQPLIESLVEAPGTTVESVATGNLRELLQVPVHERGAGVGLYLAQAFTRGFSLQASVSVNAIWRTEAPFLPSAGERVDRDSRTIQGEGAVALTYDFNAHRVPIALLGEYLIRLGERTGPTFLADDIRIHTASLGIYYSGERHLQLGLTAAGRIRSDPLLGFDALGLPAASEPLDLAYGQLSFRYLW